MEKYVPGEDSNRPINTNHVLAVECVHAALSWHKRMVIVAEYTKKNSMSGELRERYRTLAIG